MQHAAAHEDGGADAAFYPYGATREDTALDPGPAARMTRVHPGAAEVQDGDGRGSIETYFLERAGCHWLLKSQLPGAAERLLARVHEQRLPADPLDAAAELLIDLWTLRQPGRLRFIRGLQAGALGTLRWRRIARRIPQRAPLEQALRDEGHAVTTVAGPIGTQEHVLLLRRA